MDNERDNEQEVLCEKIINDLNIVFLRDMHISSFEIIPTSQNHRNKSPIIQVNENMGLESWCVKHIYHHAHNMIILLMRKRQSHNYGKLLNGTDSGGEGGERSGGGVAGENDALHKYLNIALLINPDVSSFWHIRRQLILRNHLKTQQELRYAALVLSKKPKSSEAFSYRRWLLTLQNADAATVDWPSEIGICEICADRCPNNYHAWSHRQWVLERATHSTLLSKEILFTEKFLLKHISDYSSYHYRQLLISHAYHNNYYNANDTTDHVGGNNDDDHNWPDLQHLLVYYMGKADAPYTRSKIIDILLPAINIEMLELTRLNSFLYCCNLSAHDIRIMEEQKRLYGERESFELHRCASLKFIIEQCLDMLKSSEKLNLTSSSLQKQSNLQLLKCSSNTHNFLKAVQKVEGLLGARHRKWCSLFLGFSYTESNQKEITNTKT